MPRRCERPSCSERAAVAFGFEVDRLLVWLDALSEEEAEVARSGVLCRRHADALVVPRGWWLDDRRETTPRLFHVAQVQPSESDDGGQSRSAPLPVDSSGDVGSAPRRFPEARAERSGGRRTPRTHQHDRTDELPFYPQATEGPATVHALSGDPISEYDETRAMPWSPHFDTSDDLDGLLAARTPLLSRAFGGHDALNSATS